MKTITENLLMMTLILSLCFTTSCQKDSELLLTEDIIGVWDVTGGEMLVYNNGDLEDVVKIKTKGTVTFNADGTGVDNFTLTFRGNKELLDETYNWELKGENILHVSTPSASINATIEKTKKGIDLIQSDRIPGDAYRTVEITLNLKK